MYRITLFFSLLAAFLMISSCQQKEQPARRIDLEDFFKNPEQSSYQISPNGKYLSYMAPYERRMNIFIQDIETKHTIRVTSETERDVAGYFWANNNRVLFLKDTGGDENYQLHGVNADGSNPLALTAFPNVLTQIIDDLPEIETEIIIGLNKRVPEIFDPYRLNIETGELSMLAQNPGNIQDWITDHDGKLRVAIAIVDGVNQSLLYRATEAEPFKTVITTNFKESLSPYFFSFDNKNLYASSNIGRDKEVFVLFDPETGKELDILYTNDKYDVSGLSYSRKDKKLLSAWFTGHQYRERVFFDKETEEQHQKLTVLLDGSQYSIPSLSKDENTMIVRSYSDKTRGTYYLYNKLENHLEKIADISPWLPEEEMATMHCVNYTSRDGLSIEAYLTLPKGYNLKTAKNLPVIINPHGGPWARDYWGFNPEVQFLANRGYAVFQMNFRGSTGFGRAFLEASYKQWGLSMQDDISDGVQWLIDQKIANPSKIAIYGASYGGYATLAGLAFTPELYTCGVDYVGVSNLFTFMQTIPPYWKPMLDMMYEMVGNPVADSTLMANASPVLHVDKITAPLFIAQGANDPRVNKDESDQMVTALQNRGVEVQYMVKDNEGHGFHNEENQFDFYRAMEDFLEQHIGANK